MVDTPNRREPTSSSGSILPERNLTNNMRLAEMIDDYVQHETVQTLAKSTRYGYTAHVRKFCRHLGPAATPAAITYAAVHQYIEAMKDTQRPRTIRTCIYALRHWCAWLYSEGWISANHAAKVKPPKLDKAVRDWPTDAEIAAMVEACERIANPKRRALARAVVSVLTYSGLRRCELLNLHVGDVDQQAGCLRIRHGKGDKARSVYPHPDCLAAIAAYLKVRPDCEEPRLFLLRTDVALGTIGLRTLLRELHAIAGVEGSRSLLPHGYRRGTATRLAKNGALITDIQTFLGHSSLTTTAMYLDTGQERMKQIAHLTAIPSLINGAPAATEHQSLPVAPQPPTQKARRFQRVDLRAQTKGR